MTEIDRLTGDNDWIDLEFVERERTPDQIIEVGIQLHLAGLSLSNTKQHLVRLGANAVALPFTTGCKKPIYSRQERDRRITLRWMKP